ncbi:MAG TPA: hypothetical protein VFJ47_07570 [Terriglobales bacterium]|nr:hypothetical protein [Terriglobales bacterium]
MKPSLRFLALTLLLAEVACSTGNSEPGRWAQIYAGLRARFSSGKVELQRSLEAKKAAKSWRMKTSLSLHPGAALETEVFVSCPDRERIVTRMGDKVYETVRIGHDAFLRSGDGPWSPTDLPKDAYPCGDNPGAPSPFAMMNEGRDMATVIGLMAGTANNPMNVARGDLVEIEGNSCQQWLVSFSHPESKSHESGMKYTLCLDTANGLPRQLVMGRGGMITTYYDWNKPVQIEAPLAPVASSAARQP